MDVLYCFQTFSNKIMDVLYCFIVGEIVDRYSASKAKIPRATSFFIISLLLKRDSVGVELSIFVLVD